MPGVYEKNSWGHLEVQGTLVIYIIDKYVDRVLESLKKSWGHLKSPGDSLCNIIYRYVDRVLGSFKKKSWGHGSGGCRLLWRMRTLRELGGDASRESLGLYSATEYGFCYQ